MSSPTARRIFTRIPAVRPTQFLAPRTLARANSSYSKPTTTSTSSTSSYSKPSTSSTSYSKPSSTSASFTDGLNDGLSIDPDPQNLSNSEDSKIDWSRSFHGLSTEAFSTEAADVLQAPLDPEDIEIKPGRWFLCPNRGDGADAV